VSALESHGFVERVDGQHAATAAGGLASRHLRETLSTLGTLLESRPLLARVEGFDPPVALFRDATVVTTAEDRHAPARSLVDLLSTARTVRADGGLFRTAIPTPVRDRLLDDGEPRMELVLSAETFDRTRAYHGPELRGMVESDRHELRVADGHGRTTVAVADTGSEERAVAVFYDDRDDLLGLVHTGSPDGLTWARERIDRSWATAAPVDDADVP
jgi:hypothetical protein